jgi:outer membrane lipoprotein LolB
MRALRTLAAAALLLAGCSGGPVKPDLDRQAAQQAWTAHAAALTQINQFTLSGRLASGAGVSGTLNWQQQADGSFNMHLSGPLGAGAMTINGTEKLVHVKTSKGEYSSADPQALIYRQTGWTLPIAGLRWWVLGLPSPRSASHVELDGAGRAMSIDQDGWHLAYSEYQEVDGRMLPRRFDATSGEARVKLVADRWTGLE